ncbi:isocitrate lyase/phosphoenolpyruvate mutase family protein [Leisingera sp. F5]|uniref:isocitrate lyase/PEP mutase family protein n=1 Tax=Leisingera sp. F5 TaxID=1813816 RepID=UPI000A9AD0A2|nr:isocitrate lyase/phosphoenolpyruvate mutase family protein [Leisingera sp. F5]
MQTQVEKFETFRALHQQGETFVMPNAWDAGSAVILAAMGFQALATTSAGYAFSVAKRDSFAELSRAEILRNTGQIVNAAELPVSADLENGFGHLPQDCAETVIGAVAAGAVGGAIEDATGEAERPIYEISEAADRIAAAAETARGRPFLLTARAENFLWGRPDLKDTIRRLQAFSEAGADVLYAPGLPDLAAVRTLCSEVDKPVNVVAGLQGEVLNVAELSAAGVTRISTGGSLARAALGALRRAGEEILQEGSFAYAAQAYPGGELASLMSRGQA